MRFEPILEIDCHGLNVEQAIRKVQSAVEAAHVSTYRIKVIHGFNSGTRIKSAIKEEYSYGREERVLRIEPGENMGITYLVLKEY